MARTRPDEADGLSSAASKCQSLVARSVTKRETVHGKIYQNWRRSRQEQFSGPRLCERRRSCGEAQVDALENAPVLFANRGNLFALPPVTIIYQKAPRCL